MSTTAKHCLVLCGAGRYADPWHDFARTSACLAELLQDSRTAGQRLVVRVVASDGTDWLARLADADLLMVNTGTGLDPAAELAEDPRWEQAFDQLGTWMDAGGAVLGCHTAVASFRDWPDWPRRLGGRWVRGVSGHPPLDEAVFRAARGAEEHPFWDGLATSPGQAPELRVVDERYSNLEIAPGVVPVLCHGEPRRPQVMGWTHGERLAYDGLGHDQRSFATAARRRHLLNQLHWLLR
ncbi:ThuA domain-containing protein [Luteococcus peritonei]|uniref:ThuA domain-containing protein n=1 Tax=Luteococcus peritonei TaxID=88874 RepID=A0ABW4RVY6_9ACTN